MGAVFIKWFLQIYLYDHVIFVFAVVYVMCYVYSFANVLPSLHPGDESHLVMVYDLLMYCWMRFANILLRILESVFISDIGLKFPFFVVSLCGFGFRMMLAS